MNLNKAAKVLTRRRDFLSFRTMQKETENSDKARAWDKEERDALTAFLDEYGHNEPTPDVSDLRAFRKMESNTI